MNKTFTPRSQLERASLAAMWPELREKILRPIERIPTGFPQLDMFLKGGFVRPSFVVLGAPPKLGKSTWAQIIGQRHVERGGYCLYFDFENGRVRFVRRIAYRLAQVTEDDLHGQSRERIDEMLAKAEKWFSKKAGQRFFYSDQRQITAEQFRKMVADFAGLADDEPLIVIVDSLQKLPINKLDRRAGVDTWLREFENVRDYYNVVVFVISELHRPKTGKSSYDAHKTAYKESGDIEYTADLALGMMEDKGGVVRLDAHWNRDGKTGRVGFYELKGAMADFVEVSPDEKLSGKKIKND